MDDWKARARTDFFPGSLPTKEFMTIGGQPLVNGTPMTVVLGDDGEYYWIEVEHLQELRRAQGIPPPVSGVYVTTVGAWHRPSGPRPAPHSRGYHQKTKQRRKRRKT